MPTLIPNSVKAPDFIKKVIIIDATISCLECVEKYIPRNMILETILVDVAQLNTTLDDIRSRADKYTIVASDGWFEAVACSGKKDNEASISAQKISNFCEENRIPCVIALGNDDSHEECINGFQKFSEVYLNN